MSLTIPIFLGALLANVFGAKTSESIADRVGKIEMLLQTMSEQLNTEYHARMELEKQLNNEHLARMELEKQLNNEQLARMELERKLSSTERRISSRQLAQDPEIAFFAYLSTTVHLSFGQIIVFDKVVTNIESTNSLGGYSAVTGVFTAPVNGIYVFSTTLMAHEGSASAYGIYHYNRPVVKLSVNGGGGPVWWYSNSATIVLSLSTGEPVTVRDHTPGDHYLEGASESVGQTVFSGFLLKPHHSVAPLFG